MAPKRKPVGIVRSGNAGNSSKAKPQDDKNSKAGKDGKDGKDANGKDAAPPRPPPLFPVGYKSPVTILNEKCQKLGWERPIIDTRANAKSSPETFSGAVTLRKRVSKNIYELDTVRMMPHPPLQIESAALAKHYAATYALFRFCSHLPLSLTLPPTIRPYWSELQADKAAAPAHREWEWNPDPFAAKHEVEARQAKKAVKDAGGGAGGGSGGGAGSRGGSGAGSARASGRSTPAPEDGRRGGKHWEEAPEVRMAPALREMVEGTVKKMMRRFPSAVMEATREMGGSGTSTPGSGSATPTVDVATLQPQLETLGFRAAHVTSALSALSAAASRLSSGAGAGGRADPLVLSLSILSPLEAAIEWLLLHLPEDDLPVRYRPSSSAADMVTGASVAKGGSTALVRGWLVDKLVRQAGFPRRAVETALAVDERESLALDRLGRRLCGWHGEDGGWGEAEVVPASEDDAADAEERAMMRGEEELALEAVLGDRFRRASPTELQIDIAHEQEGTLMLNVVFDEFSPYPSAQYPTRPPAFYLTSTTLPSYMRLHLHGTLLAAFRDPERHDLTSVLEAGTGGAVLSMVEHLETALPDVIATPPDIAMVTRHLVPQHDDDDDADAAPRAVARKVQRNRGPGKRRAPTEAEHDAVRARQKRLFDNPAYAKMMAERDKLPAWKERQNICAALDANRVLVVVGETGCGKSTQLPQFLLDHEIANGRGASANIIVTQPRRVAAMGVAARVAQERLEDVDARPETVGYAIRGERRASPETRLLFCTTGVVLRRLGTGDTDLSGVSHVIVDEAHERGVDTDLLICLLRDLLERNKTIKVVLMSATINEQIFINYFGGCPSLTIPGFTHPVKDYYLEDVIPQLKYQPTASRFGPKLKEEQKAAMRAEYEKLGLAHDDLRALEVLSQSDRIDYGLVAATVRHIVRTADSSGAILIFMPGVMEIRQCVNELSSVDLGAVEILPLHANLSSAEQRRVFLSTAPRRKIVVATNVAETSVTIPDVVYVVDSGRVKETQYDAENGLQRLVECWTSRASGRQRRGRAGRTQPGECFKLYTRRTESNSMARFPVPEILRTPLEALFLQVKAMNEDTDVKAFLSRAIDPPKLDAIDAAWQTLLDLGAVASEEHTAKLTALGRHMSMLPVDIRLAKMLVLATIFKCLDPVLTVAALLSSKPLFTSPIDKRDEAKRARDAFSTARSDLLTDVRAYTAVAALRRGDARRYCETNFISASTVRDVASLRQDFLSALSQIGFIGSSAAALAAASVNAANDNLVKAVLVGGLYPRVARIALPEAQYERLQQGAIQKDHEAKAVKFFDASGRVFLHPSSVLFAESGWKRGYLAYFSKAETSKVFLRDATDVPLYALLLLGGHVTVNHWAGGLMLGKDGRVKLRANTRIGVLCAQLRRLLDAQLQEAIESPHGAADIHGQVTGAMMALLARDGLSA